MVEQLLLYCYHGYTPDIGDHALELVKLAHFWQVAGLVKSCDLFLISEVAELMKPGDIEPYGQVAVLLKHKLLLGAIHVVVKQGLDVWTKDQRLEWAVVLQRIPRLSDEIWKAVAVSESF